jgi:hypothetical protein
MVACPTHYIYIYIYNYNYIKLYIFRVNVCYVATKKFEKFWDHQKLRIKPLIPPREKLKKCGNKILKLVTLLRMDLIF